MPSHLKADPLSSPQRKEKQCLTFIPEEEHAIKYRFEFSIVGPNAKDFADKILASDIAEAYRPKVKPGAEGNVNSEMKPLIAGASDGNQHVLFHNVGSDVSKTELARIRFVLLDTFSQSIPVHQEPRSASNAAVVLLFWNCNRDEGEDENAQSEFISDRLRDFTSRLAETNFMKWKPAVFLHAYGADEREEQRIKDWHAQHVSKGVVLEMFPDDQEDTMMDGIQAICEKLLSKDHGVHHNGSKQSLPPGSLERSSCCSVS
mmetsp:Transcript_22910/g.53615  ORF Transcript_22910/g.53615 Transcript_22910/m.53615 type:complete len:260 (-) Transcript_22910:53-832(-)